MEGCAAASETDDVRAAPAGGPPWVSRIPVRSVHRIVIVPVETIVRLEAEDNYVRIWADRPYLHKETLTSLCSRLDPAVFLRVHRSHAVNLTLVRELRSLPNYRLTPMLVLTTEGGQDKKAAGKQAGATGWIVKPFNPEQLLATIARVL